MKLICPECGGRRIAVESEATIAQDVTLLPDGTLDHSAWDLDDVDFDVGERFFCRGCLHGLDLGQALELDEFTA